MLLQFLMSALPEEYAITVATLDAQPNLSVQDKLVALRNREDVLRTIKNAEDKALAAKQSAVPKQAEIKCQFCNRGRPHTTEECEFRKAFNEVIDGIVRKKVERTWARKRHTSKNETKSTKGSLRTNQKDKKKKSNKHEQGHAAAVEPTSDSTEYTTTSSDSTEDELVEYANLTREEMRIPPLQSVGRRRLLLLRTTSHDFVLSTRIRCCLLFCGYARIIRYIRR
jgi:hypothetical protein